MLKLWSACLLCLSTPGTALHAREAARPSGASIKAALPLLEEALSNLTAGSAEWDAVYLRSLLHLSGYVETAGRASMARLQATRREPREWPHIIHQTAKDPDKLNPVFSASRDSWKAVFPSWEYKLWTDADMEVFMRSNYPSFMPTWENYPKQIMRIDAVRYFWLKHFGGVYADMDFFALKDFSPLLAEHDDSEVLLGRLGNGIDPTYHANNSLEIAIMISKPQAALWDYVITQLPVALHFYCFDFHRSRTGLFRESTRRLMAHPGVVQLEASIRSQVDAMHEELGFMLNPLCDDPSMREHMRDTGPAPITGPNFFTKSALLHEHGVTVVDPGLFYPIDWSTSEGTEAANRFRALAWERPDLVAGALRGEFPDAVAGTVWTHSWEDL